jgi:hypothetical protein
MEGLAAVSYGRQKLSFDDALKEATDSYFQGGDLDEALLFRSVEFLSRQKEDFYPSLCALLFLRKFSAIKNEKLDHELYSLIALGKREFLGGSLLLQEGYAALANYLFFGSQIKGFQFKQLEKGGILFRDPFPHLLENAELGLLASYLGKEWNDEDLLGKGEKLCKFFQLLIGQSGTLFPGIWIPEEEYHEKLIEIVDLLVNDKSEPHSPYLRLMKQGLGHLPSKQSHRFLMDRSLAFLKYEGKELSMIASLAGKKTGIGSLKKGEVSIVSMGPHFAPLADSEYYGIFRPSNGSQEGFKDLLIESEEGRGKIEGWTRMISPDEGDLSQSYLHIHLMAKKEEVSLKIRRSHKGEKELHFVFFVSADHAEVEEGKTFFPKALNRFEGASQKIFFKKGESFLEILPHFEGEMKVIPLAGGTHFWSANFLVAFSISKILFPYSWTIK